MKKYIIILFIIFYWIFNISNIHSLDNCEIIDKEINNYPDIKNKIDNLYTKFSSQNNQVDSYEKIGKILDKYNKILINKNISKKTQISLWYMQCQNNTKLQLSYTATCSLIDFDIDEEKYGKFEDYNFSDDLSKKIIHTTKWQYEYWNYPGWEKFIWNKYALYYVDEKLEKVYDYDYANTGFLDNWNAYFIIKNANSFSLTINNKEYIWYDNIYKKNSSFILSKNKKSKILFSDWSISNEYDTVLWTVNLENWTNVSLIGKWTITDNGLMDSNTFEWKYYLVVDWKETIQNNISATIINGFNMHTCSNKYWYSYTWDDWSRYFIFDWTTYWTSMIQHINNYGYTQPNCEPIFVSISENGMNSLYPWFDLISQSNKNISRVKAHGKDIYYLKYKYPSWYQLFKNNELIEWRWWGLKDLFDSKW